MPAVKKDCPRCGKLRFVGPWKDHPEFKELCGGCKMAVTFDPARKKKFEGRIKGELSTVGIGASVEINLSEDEN